MTKVRHGFSIQVLQRSLKVALYTQPLSPSSKYSFRSVLWGKLPTPLSLVLQPTFIEFCNTSVHARFREHIAVRLAEHVLRFLFVLFRVSRHEEALERGAAEAD